MRTLYKFKHFNCSCSCVDDTQSEVNNRKSSARTSKVESFFVNCGEQELIK